MLLPGYGMSFSPAGLLTAYHIGVLHCFHQNALISSSTHFAGSSGGALAAISSVAYTNQYNSFELLKCCEYIADECQRLGTRGTLRIALDQALDLIIPENIIDKLANRQGSVSIAYRQVLPTWSSEIVSQFDSRDDLLNVLRASCNIPLYFNGNSPFIYLRSGCGIDGFFAVPRYRFGCPIINTSYEILVTPFSPALVGLNPFANGNLPYEKKYAIISPDELSASEWPFDLRALINLALAPPPPIVKEKQVQVQVDDGSLRINSIRDRIKAEKLTVNQEVIQKAYGTIFKAGQLSAERWLAKESNYQDLELRRLN
jgi:hypothetical protein